MCEPIEKPNQPTRKETSSNKIIMEMIIVFAISLAAYSVFGIAGIIGVVALLLILSLLFPKGRKLM